MHDTKESKRYTAQTRSKPLINIPHHIWALQNFAVLWRFNFDIGQEYFSLYTTALKQRISGANQPERETNKGIAAKW